MSQDDRKRAAALAALDEVPAGATIGVGTGSTANHFIDALGDRSTGIGAAVASSLATHRRLEQRGIRVVALDDVDRIPLYVDGADEATSARHLIKGGGGALTREKIVAAASERFICILDSSKLVQRLGAFPLPVEIIPMARRHVAGALTSLGGRPVLRDGFETENGNMILDVHDLNIDDPVALESAIDDIPGVVTNGLFCRRPADLLIIGRDDGVETV